MKEQASLLTAKEVAEEFGVSQTSVYNWVKNGLKYSVERRKGLKPRRLFDRLDVEDFLSIGIWENDQK